LSQSLNLKLQASWRFRFNPNIAHERDDLLLADDTVTVSPEVAKQQT
jgi:hypothetical protein